MFTSVLLMLACQGVLDSQREDFHAFIEATPAECRLGDVVFARIWLRYKGEKPAAVSGKQFSRLLGNASLELLDRKRDTTFMLRPDVTGSGVAGSATIRAGERWLVGYELIKLPPLECIDWPFWNAQKLSKEPYELRGLLIVGPRMTVPAAGPSLRICPRSETEIGSLLELCRDSSRAGRGIPPGFDDNRANMNWFGFTHAPRTCSTSENLALLEDVLSPGGLRDVVHLTRLAQAVYDEKDEAKRRKNLSNLCAWLETLPEVERKWMSMQVVAWAAGNKGLGLFGFQLATEAALRLHANEHNVQSHHFDQSRGRDRVGEYALAAPFLKDFDERLKVLENRLRGDLESGREQ